MKKDTIRRKDISDKLNSYGVSFSFIDAVDGKLIDDEIVNRLNINGAASRKKRKITRGEIGCTFSHLLAYDNIINNNIPIAIILEDDAIVDERFGDFVSCIDNSDFPHDCDDLYILGGQNGIDKSKFISKSFWGKKKFGGQYFYKTIRSEGYIFRTCCYLLSFNSARKLKELSSREFFIADEWSLFKRKNVICDLYLADFVDHPLDLSNSHIESERLDSESNTTEYTMQGKTRWFVKKFLFASQIYYKLIYLRALIRRFYI
ncbi:glycosyltransferase family 25 protein [Shimwellia blattae]|nr:glycosyltransferase family 25 protein [Shimwellia blattae]